jgi:nucleoid DNA-binding protein
MATKKISAVKDRMTKAQVISEIADATEITKKDVRAVLASLSEQAHRHLKARGCGEFMVPELAIKLKRIKKPSTKARKGINPFTGEPMMFKAKKASTSVRAVALKACKDMASN